MQRGGNGIPDCMDEMVFDADVAGTFIKIASYDIQLYFAQKDSRKGRLRIERFINVNQTSCFR